MSLAPACLRWRRAALCLFACCALVAASIGATGAAEPPRLIVQTGQAHTKVAAWSPDGRLVASGGTDGRVILWDATTARQLRALPGQAIGLTTLQFSGDGSMLLAGSATGAVMSWDVKSGQPQPAVQFGASPVQSIAMSRDASVVMVAVQGGQIVVVDAKTPRSSLIDLAPYSLLAAALSPDHATVAVARAPGDRILLYDTWTGHLRRELQGHAAQVNTLRFSPDGTLLASGSDDRMVRLWNVENGTATRVLEGLGHEVASVEFSADGRTLAATGVVTRLWDVASGALRERQVRSRQYLTSATFSPTGDRLLTINASGTDIWSTATGDTVGELRGRADEVAHVAFSPDGQALLVDGHVWDLVEGQSRTVGFRGGRETFAQWIGDGRVFGADRDDAVLRDPTGRRPEIRFPQGARSMLDAAVSPDGAWVATALTEGTVQVFDARSGVLRHTLKVNDHAVRHVEFSPDGQWLAAGGVDRPVTLWEVRSGRAVAPVGEAYVQAFRFTPDSTALLFTALDGQVRRHPVKGGPDTVLVDHGGPVTALRLSGDGTWLATGGVDGRIRVWEVASGRAVATLTGHEDAVRDLAFSPDGSRVASTSGDATTRLWTRADGRLIATLVQLAEPHRWTATGVVVAPDGRFDAPDLEGLRGLHWVLDAAPFQPLPLEAFMRDYYEPRLLGRLLAGEALPPVRVQTAGDFRVPRVRIADVVPDPASPGRVQVEVEVTPVDATGARVESIRDLRLFRDAQLVGAVDGEVRVDPRTGVARVRWPVALPQASDRSTVEFSAYASNGARVKSETTYRTYGFERPLRPAARRAILVTIGVDVYESPSWDLAFAASDARLIGTTLADRMRKLGRFDEVVQLELVSDIDAPEAATKDAIHAALKKLAQGVGRDGRPVGPDDLVIVSFSGHGAIDRDGAFYLLAHDVGENAPRLVTPELLARGIRDDELGGWLRDVDAGEMVLILDACHAAASVAQPGFKPGPMGSRGLGQLAYDKGLRILAATQPGDVALESEATQHGLLSYALIKDGIEQGRADFRPQDRAIGLAEWLGYALERVPSLAAEVRAGTVESRGAPAPRVRNATGLADTPAARALQKPALFDFRRTTADVEIAVP